MTVKEEDKQTVRFYSLAMALESKRLAPKEMRGMLKLHNAKSIVKAAPRNPRKKIKNSVLLAKK
jgi:hypothetical protein